MSLLQNYSVSRYDTNLSASFEIQGIHGGDYEDYCLLGYDHIQLGGLLPMFQRNLLAPSSVYMCLYWTIWCHILKSHISTKTFERKTLKLF
jgi:hypothetical protein